MRISSNIISICLIGSGVLAWALTARPLVENPDLDVPLNPLGIKRSPYGEVFAMAMQTPIDNYIHAGMGESHSHDDHSHDHDDHSHDHDDHSSDHEHNVHDDRTSPQKIKEAESLNSRLLSLLGAMKKASDLRTNPKPASDAHMRHLRREAEDKLRFAYEMDPSHYGNYNSLHFFLTEPAIGTRPELTPTAAKLAEETINYCLKQEGDPRPSLTAAAACTNILHLMFTDHNDNKSPTFTVLQMQQCLNLLDYCLNRYNTIAKQWDESKNWELLSAMRITECETRYSFISKIRDAAAATVDRLEKEAQSPR